MPIVTVVAAGHPRIDGLLKSVAEAVAVALDLGEGDVIATFVQAGASVVTGASDATSCRWPIVSIHGSDRGRDRMESARGAARSAVTEWCTREGVEYEGVWSQWLLPMPVPA